MSEAASQNQDTRVSVGVVAIGRNEGERLERCLQSVRERVAEVVYVDSGSSDNSVAMAQALGVEVVQLDLSTPFTAARSRNSGVQRLLDCERRAMSDERRAASDEQRPADGAPLQQVEHSSLVARHSSLEFVQVVDGDCEVVEGWIKRALEEMRKPGNEKVAVVCGRRRERQPEASTYNHLIDMEWNTPIGEVEVCGGDALIRLSAFKEAGGYDVNVIAGEEPEMCWRLRHAGWKVLRIDAEMTLHDAQMNRFGQWWKRSVRSGHAYAEGLAMHGHVDGYCARTVQSIVAWALVLPLVALGLAWFTWGVSLLLLGLYIVLWARIRAYRMNTRGDSAPDASMYANYCVVGKFAELQGVVKYWWNRVLGRRTKLIEYKGVASAPTAVPVADGGKS